MEELNLILKEHRNGQSANPKLKMYMRTILKTLKVKHSLESLKKILLQVTNGTPHLWKTRLITLFQKLQAKRIWKSLALWEMKPRKKK